MPPSTHTRRRLLQLRTLAVVALCLVFVGTWPGSVLRPVILELTAAPLPADVGDRDGTLDVVAHAAAAPPQGTAGPDDKPVLVGVRVHAFAIIDGRAHAAAEAVTDATGRASLTRLPHGEHWIVAETDGRARASQMVVVVSGSRRLDMDLGEEHVLEVRVTTEDGDPIEGAELEVRGSDPFPVGARTKDAGTARVGRLGEGPFTIVARAPGYAEVTKRRVPEGAPCVITLGKQGALVVKVLGETGEPAPGARVLVASPSLWPARVAETGADGTVRIGGLDPGGYALRAVQGTRVSPIELGVAVAKGEQNDLELRLQPGVVIAARIASATDDDPIAKARVTLAEGGLSPFPIEGLTDKKGLVLLGPITRGASSLAVRADGFVPKGAVRVDEAQTGEVKIALLKGGSLVGRIVDARGFAVDGATIRVVGTDLEGMPIDEDPQRTSFSEAHFTSALAGPSPLVPAGELGVMPGPVPAIPHGPLGATFVPPPGGGPKTTSDEPWVSARDGTFTATPISPGRVRALVRHPQYVEAMSEVVTLVSEKEARVEVVLLRGGALEGKVVDARGRGVPGAHVTALASRGSLERSTRTGTDGSFAFAALPDAVTLLVSRDEEATQVVARLEVSVPEAGKKSVEITLPEARPPLPVKVTDDRGRSVSAAQVSAVSLDTTEGLRVTAFTNDRGECELANGRGLPLRVEVRAPGRAAKIVVTAADTASLAVELAAAESVSGEIWANRRETIEGAEVTLQTDLGTRHARTNKDGVFTIGDVAPGPARLRVRKAGRAPVSREVVIEEHAGRRPTELPKLEMAEEGIVEGTVLDTKGNPVPGARVAKDAVPTYLPASGPATGMAVADARGRFKLGELPEGSLTLEAYAPDLGRARLSGVRVIAGRTTDSVKIHFTGAEAAVAEPLATGGVAVTLGETIAGLDPSQVVIVSVAEGSEAERAGLLAYDLVIEVGGAPVANVNDARARLSGPVHDDVLVKVRRGDRSTTLRVAREQVRR